jgi:hypothetical protein
LNADGRAGDLAERDARVGAQLPPTQVSYMSSPVLPDDPQLDVPAVIVPDRADAPISEITERFFRAVLLKVPLDRIEELHLFSPLRQGGVETGIAVIAAREVIVPTEPDQPVADPELPLEPTAESDSDTDADAVEAIAEDAIADEAIADEATADEEAMPPAGDLPPADDAVETVETSEAAEPESVAGEAGPEAVAEALEADSDEAVVAVSAPIVRHTVFTARYRLVQKGPERGKWEADVVAEAEAPLITVETVVRGVQRRAGEESDTTRFTAPQIARALRLEIGAA